MQKRELRRAVFGDESCIGRLPWLNTAVLVYVGVTVAVLTLYLIAPVVTALNGTILYSMPSYLGIVGAVLLCVDLFSNKVLWRGPYVWLLYGICLLAVVSSLRTISYGVKDNLYFLCWAALDFALLYSVAHRGSEKMLRRFAAWTYGAALVPWTAACCVSLGQYVLQIGYSYVSDPQADASLTRQGFVENRLFGVFNPLNHAAYVSLMLLLIGLYYILRTKKPLLRAALIVADVVLFLHVMLSNSRSAMIAMWICAVVIAALLVRSRVTSARWRRNLAALGAAVLMAAVCVPVYTGIRDVAGHVPYWVGTAQDRPDQPNGGEDLLHREGLEDDATNNRFTIWKSYLDLHEDIGLTGLSPGNYMAYIRENHPENYLVKYIRDTFPEKYEAGLIYHVHNGYLMVYVSTGLLGFGLLVAFLLLCVVRVFRYLHRHPETDPEMMIAMTVVIAGGVAAFFDKGIFFMDNTPAVLFWIAAGYVMKKAAAEKRLPEKKDS